MKKPWVWHLPALTLALVFVPFGSAGMIDKKGMEPWETCGLCHGAEGISAVGRFPKLAGQKPSYIVRQVLDFSEGIRTNDNGQMRMALSELREGELEYIASYFSALPSPGERAAGPDGPVDNKRYKLGRSVFTGGRDDIPACIGCHGNGGSSAPWLDGQHRQYLRKQLQDFKQGVRKGDDAKVMQAVAKELTMEEIEALAYYLSLTSLERGK